MIDTPATFLAMAGAAFVLASYAPTALESKTPLPQDRPQQVAGLEARAPLAQERIPLATSVTGKGDRLSVPRPAPRERSTISIVEIVGLSEATVIMRDRDGTVLYRSDPQSNTTVVAKGTDLPIVTLKEAPAAPGAQQAPSALEPSSVQGLSPKREGQDSPSGERRPRTIGCETAVSPLARGDTQRVPGRCLAQAEAPSAS
jgi:hypothetical protein